MQYLRHPGAILAWIADIVACNELQQLPLGLPYPQLHAFGWHFGTSLGLLPSTVKSVPARGSPTTAPEAHPPAHGCPSCPRRELSSLGCRRRATVALWCLPKVADVTLPLTLQAAALLPAAAPPAHGARRPRGAGALALRRRRASAACHRARALACGPTQPSQRLCAPLVITLLRKATRVRKATRARSDTH